MPKIRRPYRPEPDPIALERFLMAMEEVRREDINLFRSLCTGKKVLVRRLEDGTLIAISRRGRQFKLSVSGNGQQIDGMFSSLDSAIEMVISNCEECGIDWRVNGVEECCPCPQCGGSHA